MGRKLAGLAVTIVGGFILEKLSDHITNGSKKKKGEKDMKEDPKRGNPQEDELLEAFSKLLRWGIRELSQRWK